MSVFNKNIFCHISQGENLVIPVCLVGVFFLIQLSALMLLDWSIKTQHTGLKMGIMDLV